MSVLEDDLKWKNFFFIMKIIIIKIISMIKMEHSDSYEVSDEFLPTEMKWKQFLSLCLLNIGYPTSACFHTN